MDADSRRRLRALDGKPLMFSGAEDLRRTMDRIDRDNATQRLRPAFPPPPVRRSGLFDAVLFALILGVFARMGWVIAEWVFA